MTLEELYRLLRSGHIQAQGIVDTLREPLLVLDKTYTVLSANPAFYRTFETDFESTVGHTLFELGDGQWDIAELRRLLIDVVPKAAAIIGYRVEHDFPRLGIRSMDVSVRQLHHPDNNSTHMLVVFDDVTERKRADENRDILLAETRHRMKNMIATIKVIARQTEAKGTTGEEYREKFLGRIDALLSAQDFISGDGADANLEALVQQCLLPIASNRVKLVPGPPVILADDQILPVAMILHELTTNALKYGALSNQSGTLELGWTVEQDAKSLSLILIWREIGGPPVIEPQRRGFGSRLIDHSVKGEGGKALFDYAQAGLQVQIAIPLRNVATRGDAS